MEKELCIYCRKRVRLSFFRGRRLVTDGSPIEENAESVGMALASDVMRMKSATKGTAKPWLGNPTWSIETMTMMMTVVFAKEEAGSVFLGHCMRVETVGS